jgi:hypothetical protein
LNIKGNCVQFAAPIVRGREERRKGGFKTALRDVNVPVNISKERQEDVEYACA